MYSLPSIYNRSATGAARIHFVMQCFMSQLVFWIFFLVSGIPVLEGVRGWIAGMELGLALLFFAVLERALRNRRERSLGGMSKQERWAVSHRQMVYLLGTVAGYILLREEQVLPGWFLAGYVAVSWIWLGWSNVLGFRLVRRKLYRKWMKRARLAGNSAGESAVARAA